jgi:malate dehydrogenase (oxaloacetate-decarboxylating)
MWWENKLMRTFRCRLRQRSAVLGRLLGTLGKEKAFLGEITTLRMGGETVDRDIVVFADNEEHMNHLITTVRSFPDAELIEVRDEVMEVHQGGGNRDPQQLQDR